MRRELGKVLSIIVDDDRARTLLLIERGEAHEIRNTGRRPLRTLNFYVAESVLDARAIPGLPLVSE
jgi:hypothetical protein